MNRFYLIQRVQIKDGNAEKGILASHHYRQMFKCLFLYFKSWPEFELFRTRGSVTAPSPDVLVCRHVAASFSLASLSLQTRLSHNYSDGNKCYMATL